MRFGFLFTAKIIEATWLDCYTSVCGGCGLVYQYISCLTSLLCFPILFSSSPSFFALQQISSFPRAQYSSRLHLFQLSSLEFNQDSNFQGRQSICLLMM